MLKASFKFTASDWLEAKVFRAILLAGFRHVFLKLVKIGQRFNEKYHGIPGTYTFIFDPK